MSLRIKRCWPSIYLGKRERIIRIGQIWMVFPTGIVRTRVEVMVWPRLEVININN